MADIKLTPEGPRGSRGHAEPDGSTGPTGPTGSGGGAAGPTGPTGPGGGGSPGTVNVEDEGVLLGMFTTLNFVGAGVTATDAGAGVADVTIPGSALGPGTTNTIPKFTSMVTIGDSSVVDDGAGHVGTTSTFTSVAADGFAISALDGGINSLDQTVGPFMTASLAAGVTNDWDPGPDFPLHAAVRVNGTAPGSTISGLIPVRLGALRFLMNSADSTPLNILHLDPGSLITNRIFCPDGRKVSLPTGGTAVLYCLDDATHGWRFLGLATDLFPVAQIDWLTFGPGIAATLGSASVNDFSPAGFATATRVRVTTPSGGAVITGMDAFTATEPRQDGQVKIIENYGDFTFGQDNPLGFTNYDVASAAPNRFYLPGLSGLSLPIGANAIFIYDLNTPIGGLWKLVAHSGIAKYATNTPHTPTALGATQNDWAPSGLSTHSRFRVFVPATGTNLTGLQAPKDQVDGATILLQNMGDGANTPTATLTLKENDPGSAAANRFYLPGLVDLVLPVAGSVTLVYDAALLLWEAIAVTK